MAFVENKCFEYKIRTISEIKNNNNKFDISQNLRFINYSTYLLLTLNYINKNKFKNTKIRKLVGRYNTFN